MTDELAAPSETEDTPTPEPETAEEATPQAEATEPAPYEDESLGWEDRYKHLQSFATRTAQERARLEEQFKAAEPDVQFMEALRSGDQDAFRQIAEAYDADPEAVLKALGLTQAEVDEALDESGDTSEFRDPRVDQMLAEQQERESQQIAHEMASHIERLATEAGVKLTERQQRTIFMEAIENGINPEGTEKAFQDWLREDYEPLKQEAVKSYRESKKAPAPPQSGSPGVQTPPSDAKARLALANQVAQRAIDSAG